MALFGRKTDRSKSRKRRVNFDNIDYDDEDELLDWLKTNQVAIIIKDGGFSVFSDSQKRDYVMVYTDLNELLEDDEVEEYAEVDFEQLTNLVDDLGPVDYVLINPEVEAVRVPSHFFASGPKQVSGDEEEEEEPELEKNEQSLPFEAEAPKVRELPGESEATDPFDFLTGPAASKKKPAHTPSLSGDFSWARGALLDAPVSKIDIPEPASEANFESGNGSKAEGGKKTAAEAFGQLSLFGGSGLTDKPEMGSTSEKSDDELPSAEEEMESPVDDSKPEGLGEKAVEEESASDSERSEDDGDESDFFGNLFKGSQSASESATIVPPIEAPVPSKNKIVNETAAITFDKEQADVEIRILKQHLGQLTSHLEEIERSLKSDVDADAGSTAATAKAAHRLQVKFDGRIKSASRKALLETLNVLEEIQFTNVKVLKNKLELSFATESDMTAAKKILKSETDFDIE